MNSIAKFEGIVNEPILDYAPGSKERKNLKEVIHSMKGECPELPMIIGGKEIFTDEIIELHTPHDKGQLLCKYSQGKEEHVKLAIEAALKAQKDWENMPWEERASIFLKAAELISTKYREKTNAVTMLGQSKNIYQAEIDCVCEFVDFLRLNCRFMHEIYRDQPYSPKGIFNRMEYRPLEGFILAIPPFNFTSIAGNLACSPALMGNTILWKPSYQSTYAAHLILQILMEAGLPDGVINLIHSKGPVTSKVCLEHPSFAGLHFTGSLPVMQRLWKTVGNNIENYISFPRIVGETGGKDFIVAHPSADPKQVITALSRGAFEYQGQKCSAASRAYIPSNLWKEIKAGLIGDLSSFKMGSPEDFSNFINAVIDEAAFDTITEFIDDAKNKKADIISGGNFDKTKGYFIEPTIIVTDDPGYRTMCEEIFGPVLTIYVYDENKYDEILDIADSTSPFALTGSVFATDRNAIIHTLSKLRNAAGNFYINDKPTGAVVNQQPFGGARASGTNDKAGSKINLLRWVSARSIKETFNPPTDYRYPFMEKE
jgi:1-pyrroline-5-carboxylate dehydrogenase